MKMLLWLIVPAMAFVNGFRGGGFGADRVPGHPRLWAAGAVLLMALLVLPWPGAVTFGLGFLVWCLPPWGHLIGLGRYAPDRPISDFERSILEASWGKPRIALWMRHLLVLPMVLAVFPVLWALALPALIAAIIVLAYEAGWRFTPKAPIRTAELITGALLGVLLLGGCRADTNAYYGKGGSTGAVRCQGACP